MVTRVISGIFGIVAGFIAVSIPVLYIANVTQESESAQQYGGHMSVSGAVFGTLLVFGISALFGAGAYKLLRRALGMTDKGIL